MPIGRMYFRQMKIQKKESQKYKISSARRNRVFLSKISRISHWSGLVNTLILHETSIILQNPMNPLFAKQAFITPFQIRQQESDQILIAAMKMKNNGRYFITAQSLNVQPRYQMKDQNQEEGKPIKESQTPGERPSLMGCIFHSGLIKAVNILIPKTQSYCNASSKTYSSRLAIKATPQVINTACQGSSFPQKRLELIKTFDKICQLDYCILDIRYLILNRLQMENITKSIIYGNFYENRYGKFLPVCSSITDRSSIQNILDYLHQTPHFKKYNRTAYAYRVQQVPIVFITEKKNLEYQHYEGKHSDETIQGSGEKLLHLLEKFNIRNVFIGILIQQFNPLMPFQTTNYRAIVQNCRLLLDELYKKVASLQDKVEIKSYKDLLLHNNQSIKLKRNNITENIELPNHSAKKIQVKDRPNHIYSNGKPDFLAKKSQLKNTEVIANSAVYQIKFLWERCKVIKDQFQSVVNSLEEKQIEQMKYYSMYQKNSLINYIIKLFKLYLGVDRNFLMSEYNFSQLKQIKFEAIQQKRLKRLEDHIKANKRLSIENVMKQNRPMGMILSLIELKIRFSKTLKRISELMEKSNLTEKDAGQIEDIKRHSSLMSFKEEKLENLKYLESGIKGNRA